MNNVIQIVNAIYMARESQGTFTFNFKHAVIESFHVSFVVDRSRRLTNFSAGFFYDHKPNITNQVRRDILQSYVLKHMKVHFKPIGRSDTLVMHIRSADVVAKNPNSVYVQPPLSFYRHVIEAFQYATIVIVTSSDLGNPVITPLLNLYHNRIRIHSSSINSDIAILLSARNLLVNSRGSFGRMCMLMSRNVEVSHQPFYVRSEAFNSYHDSRCLNTTVAHGYLVSDYILPGKWTFDETQQRLMFNYPLSSIVDLY